MLKQSYFLYPGMVRIHSLWNWNTQIWNFYEYKRFCFKILHGSKSEKFSRSTTTLFVWNLGKCIHHIIKEASSRKRKKWRKIRFQWFLLLIKIQIVNQLLAVQYLLYCLFVLVDIYVKAMQWLHSLRGESHCVYLNEEPFFIKITGINLFFLSFI